MSMLAAGSTASEARDRLLGPWPWLSIGRWQHRIGGVCQASVAFYVFFFAFYVFCVVMEARRVC